MGTSANKRKQIWEKKGPICLVCLRAMRLNEVTADHILRKADGGSNAIENLRPLHNSCHQRLNMAGQCIAAARLYEYSKAQRAHEQIRQRIEAQLRRYRKQYPTANTQELVDILLTPVELKLNTDHGRMFKPYTLEQLRRYASELTFRPAPELCSTGEADQAAARQHPNPEEFDRD